MLMADDKTTKMPEQPVTDSGPGNETTFSIPDRRMERRAGC